jgi:methionyl aminopeptidase
MSIKNDYELMAMKKISQIVAQTLKQMCAYAQTGMSTKELDVFGGNILKKYGAQSAPMLAYKFPGYTCISINDEVAHGIPSKNKILKEGDLINIDVSAECDGYWADNGASFVLGEDLNGHNKLVYASKDILKKAISQISAGVRIALIGKTIETEAKKMGFKVIKNLAGHGVGLSLHESPEEILNCYDKYNRTRFSKNSTVAIETFISTKSNVALKEKDGWTLKGKKGGFVAQHEHTIMVTETEPIILTTGNGIWD